MDLSGCANCFPSLPAQKDLAVLYLQLGYLNDNLFISCAFYMVRDRSCWQRRNTARGMQAPWQQLPAYIPLYFLFFFYLELKSLLTAPVLWIHPENEKKNKETPAHTVPVYSSAPSISPRAAGDAGLTWGDIAMGTEAPNEMSLPKMNSHADTTTQCGFNYPRTHADKILSSDTHGQIADLEATRQAFLWLSE